MRYNIATNLLFRSLGGKGHEPVVEKKPAELIREGE